MKNKLFHHHCFYLWIPIAFFFLIANTNRLLSTEKSKESLLSYILTPKGEIDPLTKNKQLISDFYTAILKEDLKTLEQILDPNYEIQDSTIMFQSRYSPFDAFSKKIDIRIKALHQALPNFKLTTELLLAEENKVFANVLISGVQKGRFLGTQATGKPVNIRLFTVFTLKENKIIQINEMWNQLSVMKQMGYIVL